MYSTFFTILEPSGSKDKSFKSIFEILDNNKNISGTVHGNQPKKLMHLVKITAINKYGIEKVDYKESISNEGLNEFCIKIKI